MMSPLMHPSVDFNRRRLSNELEAKEDLYTISLLVLQRHHISPHFINVTPPYTVPRREGK